MTREKTQEELEEEEESSEEEDPGSSPSSAILPVLGLESKRSSRYGLEDIHTNYELSSNSSSPKKKKQWRTSLDSEHSPWIKCLTTDDLTPVMTKFVQPLVAEFIGTFILTFTGVCYGCSTHKTDVGGPVSTGLTVTAVILALGHISGAHINPAVSIGFLIAGEIKCLLFIFYVGAQFLGATCAGLMARGLMTTTRYQIGHAGMVLIPEETDALQAIVMEAVITFTLVYVVLQTVCDQPELTLTPLAVGFIVLINIFAAGEISGGCMNPARSTGATMAATGVQFLDSVTLHQAWLDNLWYVLGTSFGAIAAGGTYRLLMAQNPKYNLQPTLRQKFSRQPGKQDETGPTGISDATDP